MDLMTYETLRNYKAKDKVEEMAINVLLADENDLINVPGLIYLSVEEIEKLLNVITDLKGKFSI